MLRSFLTFINEHIPELPIRKTLLAVSGGVDSMVMAELFRQAGFAFAIAHCNFGLRQEESDQDEQFVRQWAQNHQIKFLIRRFNTEEVAQKDGISIQMAARALRYAWFEEEIHNHAFDYLATAHHVNDLLETTLLNLVRGTGPTGLPGISPLRNSLCRPLLFATKKEILDFAHQEQIGWREDSSNLSDYYKRNLLRHQVIPVLQQLNPSLEATFSQTAERLLAANAFLKEAVTSWKEQVMRQSDNTYFIDIASLNKAPEPAFLLHSLLEPFGYTYVQSKQIVASLSEISGKFFYSKQYQLLRDRTELILEPIRAAPLPFSLQITEATQRLEVTDHCILQINRFANEATFPLSFNADKAYFDEEQIAYPLTVRPWQKGDWLCPLGMHGKRKKVSDLLIDAKIPLSQKKEYLVVLDQQERIIWLIGLRSDERFKVRPTTQRMLILSKTTK